LLVANKHGSPECEVQNKLKPLHAACGLDGAGETTAPTKAIIKPFAFCLALFYYQRTGILDKGSVKVSAQPVNASEKVYDGHIPIGTPLRRRVFGPEFTHNLIRWADVVCMTVFLVWYFLLRPGTPLISTVSFPAPPFVSTMAGIATAATFLKTFAFPVRATHLLLAKGGFRLLLHPGDGLHGLEQFIPWKNIKSVMRVVGPDDSTRLLKIYIRKRRVLNIHPNEQIERIVRDVRLNAADRLATTSSLWFMMMPLLQLAAAALAVAVLQQWGIRMLALGLTFQQVSRARRAL